MVIMLVAILAAVALPQFVDFRVEAKDASVNAAVGALRIGINNAAAQMKVRCDAGSGTFPSLASLNANNLVTGLDCTALQIPVVPEQKLLSGPTLPANPWGPAQSNAVTACVGAGTGCNQTDATACDGAAYVPATSDGWCYNPATGEIWANSALGEGPALEYTF